MKNSIVLKKSWKEFSFRLFASFLGRAALLVIPVVFGSVVDNISLGNYDQAIFSAIWLLVIFILYRLNEITATYAWHRLYNKMYNIYTDLAINKTYNNSIFSLSRISLSEYINIMNNDVNVMCSFFCNLTTRIFRVVEFIIILVYFFSINLYIGFAGIAVSLIVFSIMFFSSKKIESTNQKRTISLDKKTSAIHEFILCIKEIKTLDVFTPIKERVLNRSNEYTSDWLKQRVVEDGFRWGNVAIIETFRIIILIYGIYLISIGQMQLGVVLVIYNYYAQLVDNISEFSVINNEYRNLTVSIKRFNKIWEYSKKTDNNTTIMNNKPKGEIEFKNILYGYKDNPTLENLSFNIKPNTITAITGPSGSGRTGIFDLLLKLNRQHEGEITIDNIDINKYGTNEYYYLVSSVFKEPVFFNMSIKDNLYIVEPDFEKVVLMCKELGIHEDIVNLKDGYDTVIDNSADNINTSIKFILGIIRVLLKNPKIMLFDETFSTFDNESKVEIMKLLTELKKDHTILIITRDIEVLKQSDKVLVLEKGKLHNTGPHKSLIKKDLVYQNNINT